MSDEIKVGDRVRWDTAKDGLVLAIHGDLAWVLFPNESLPCTVWVDALTRIEPEAVALTPKYPVGDRVKFYAKDNKEPLYKVVEPRIDYLLERPDGQLAHRLEFQLEPAPEPCDRCGK